MSKYKTHENHKKGGSKGEILLYQAEDGQVRLDARLQDETVWLTQPLMAELFQTTQQNISQHIRNLFEAGELTPEATHKKFFTFLSMFRRRYCPILIDT